MKTIKKQTFLLSTLTLALLASAAHAAPVPPDAGQTIRELQTQPEFNPPKTTPPLRIEGGTAPRNAASETVRIKVAAIHIKGNTVFPTSELEALVADLAGGEHSLAELDAGAARITAYYRARGYVVARAYLPAQDIVDGTVEIVVLEGLVGQVNIHNQSRLSDKVANAQMERVKTGDALQAAQVDRALLLLADTPGVGGARATLQPGVSVGTSDLLVELDPAKAYAADVELDNYGNRYTGQNRLGAAVALNSPLKIGDQLTLRGLVSDQSMTYARIAYQLPVGNNGMKLGGAYADTRYQLGKEFTALQGHGTATSSSLYATYPFIRSQSSNLSGTLTYESKKLVDQTNVPVSLIDKRVELVNLGLAGNHQDALLGAGVTSFDASVATGKLSMDAVTLAADAASAKSNGNFTRLGYSLSRLQRVTGNDALSLALSGQQANKNLNSSEKFYLGGANGVRAYPQGEGIGDQGWMANLEARHNLMEQLQGIVFYDAGSVTINRNAYIAGVANTRSIAGAGVGLNAQYGWAQLKTSLAWRTSGGQPQSIPVSVGSNPMFWAQLSGQF